MDRLAVWNLAAGKRFRTTFSLLQSQPRVPVVSFGAELSHWDVRKLRCTECQPFASMLPVVAPLITLLVLVVIGVGVLSQRWDEEYAPHPVLVRVSAGSAAATQLKRGRLA